MCAKQLASFERSHFTNVHLMHEQFPTCAEFTLFLLFTTDRVALGLYRPYFILPKSSYSYTL